MLIDVAAILVAISVAILVVFLVPAIVEIRKTVVAVRELTENTDRELRPVLHELQSTLTEVKGLVSEASSRIEEVQALTTAVGETGRNLRVINGVLASVADVLSLTNVWAAGAKAAGLAIVDRLVKKRKGEG